MEFVPDLKSGFLPREDPLTELPKEFSWLDELGASLPLLINSGGVRKTLSLVRPVQLSGLRSEPEINRALMIYSFLASAYVHAPGEKTADRIPAGIAVPLVELSKIVGRPPIMSYPDYALNNWKIKNGRLPITAKNLELLQKFSGATDETWFIVEHVEIEAEAAPALYAINMAKAAVKENNSHLVSRWLRIMYASLEKMNKTMKRMTEGCSPDVYYHSVRPYLFGFKGVFYEGYGSVKGRRRTLRGETGAQSSIVPALVAALHIEHSSADGRGGKNPMLPHLRVMRRYMPPEHRKFIARAGKGPSIRNYVLREGQYFGTLRDAYNKTLLALSDFRSQHFEWARLYIHDQVQNPEGSGGTIFMPWLKQLRDETEKHLIQ